MCKRQVQSGDSIPSIARDNGFFWETLWNHPENAALKALRNDANMLLEGDEVFVPEKETKWESCATEQLHTFKRLGDAVKFKLQLRKMGKPRKDEDYVLIVDGRRIKGKTDGDGKLECFIPEGLMRIGTRKYKDFEEIQVPPDERVRYQGLHHGASYLEHLDFLDAVRSGAPPRVTATDGLLAVAVGIAAHRSIDEARPVTLAELGV